MLHAEKKLPKYQDVSVDLTNGNGNELTEMGGNWNEKSVPAHL